MSEHVLEREQRLALGPEEAFEFFADAPHRFVDVQVRGPCELARGAFVAADVERIFEYRRAAISRLLAEPPA